MSQYLASLRRHRARVLRQLRHARRRGRCAQVADLHKEMMAVRRLIGDTTEMRAVAQVVRIVTAAQERYRR